MHPAFLTGLVVALCTGVLGTAPASAQRSEPAPAAPATEGPAGPAPITAVVVGEDTIDISGQLVERAGAEIEIHELATYEEPSAVGDGAPVVSVPADAEGGSFAAQIDRFDGERDRYHSKFVVADAGEPVGEPTYVTDVAFDATWDYPFPEPPTKKGLQVEMPGVSMAGDAEELGVDHATVNFRLDGLFYEDPVADEDMIVYEFDGREYYFRRSHVENYDAQVRSLSDNGMLVYLILLLYNEDVDNAPVDKLIHPDAELDEGTVFAFNVSDAEGVGYLRAAASFLAERYTRLDERYGSAQGFIVGNEIDSQWIWSNMGEQTLTDFMTNYERTVRLVWQAAREHYAHPRVYISLTHYWTLRHADNPLRYYAGRDVIDEMNRLSKQGGDYPWHVAQHPYPENLPDPRTWDDSTATDDFDTPRVTFKNLHILPEYLRRDELLTDGEPRRVILSEQGFNTPDLAEETQQLQAAAYAYAYYKSHHLPEIDAFILHRHVDHKQEGGLHLGVWMWDPDRPEASVPGQRKFIYDVFRDIDTARSLEVTEFAKPIIGIDDWSEVVPNWDPSSLDVRTPPTTTGASGAGAAVQPRPVKPEQWERAENATSVTADGDTVTAEFDSLASVWKGVQARWSDPVDASATPNLVLGARLPDGSPVDTAELKVKVYSGSDVLEAGAYLDQAGDEHRIAVDLRQWDSRSAIDRVKVWARSDSNADWDGSLELTDVAFARAAPPPSGPEAAERNIGVHAWTYAFEPDSPLRVEVVNHDRRVLAGPLEIDPPDHLELATTELDLGELAPGERAEFEVAITEFDAENAPDQTQLAFTRANQTVRAPVVQFVDPLEIAPPAGALPPGAELLYDFEGDPEGWVAGANIDAVSTAPSFLNAPQTPYHGDEVLVGESAEASAQEWRTVEVAPDEPIDLSGAEAFLYYVNSYGGVPNASYETRVVLTTAQDELVVDSPYEADGWNEIVVDVTDLAGRDAVTGIEISHRAVGSDIDWASHFQVDAVGLIPRWEPDR